MKRFEFNDWLSLYRRLLANTAAHDAPIWRRWCAEAQAVCIGLASR